VVFYFVDPGVAPGQAEFGSVFSWFKRDTSALTLQLQAGGPARRPIRIWMAGMPRQAQLQGAIRGQTKPNVLPIPAQQGRVFQFPAPCVTAKKMWREGERARVAGYREDKSGVLSKSSESASGVIPSKLFGEAVAQALAKRGVATGFPTRPPAHEGQPGHATMYRGFSGEL